MDIAEFQPLDYRARLCRKSGWTLEHVFVPKSGPGRVHLPWRSDGGRAIPADLMLMQCDRCGDLQYGRADIAAINAVFRAYDNTEVVQRRRRLDDETCRVVFGTDLRAQRLWKAYLNETYHCSNGVRYQTQRQLCVMHTERAVARLDAESRAYLAEMHAIREHDRDRVIEGDARDWPGREASKP